MSCFCLLEMKNEVLYTWRNICDIMCAKSNNEYDGEQLISHQSETLRTYLTLHIKMYVRSYYFYFIYIHLSLIVYLTHLCDFCLFCYLWFYFISIFVSTFHAYQFKSVIVHSENIYIFVKFMILKKEYWTSKCLSSFWNSSISVIYVKNVHMFLIGDR